MSLYLQEIEILLNTVCRDCLPSYFYFVVTLLKENDRRFLVSKGILLSTY